jgi:hypothetical protein
LNGHVEQVMEAAISAVLRHMQACVIGASLQLTQCDMEWLSVDDSGRCFP